MSWINHKISASLSLFMLNYPQGRIFLGDAGAYTLGFLLAVSLITLHSKHIEISAWSILLLIFWPLADMGHSIFRRRLHGKRSDRPDKLHLHHVIMRSLVILSRGSYISAVGKSDRDGHNPSDDGTSSRFGRGVH